MSLESDQKSTHSTSYQDHQGGMKNDNKQTLFVPDGDANANQIRADENGTKDMNEMRDLAALPPLVSQRDEQDKIIIWGTDSQCDDPDLEEFEMLECLELEAYLEEEEHKSEKVIGNGSISEKRLGSYDQNEEVMDKEMNHNGEEDRAATWNILDPESTVSHSSVGRGKALCLSTADFSSENDIFVSCVSTMSIFGGSFASALDSTGEVQTYESQHISTEPYKTICEDLSLASQSIPTNPVNAKSPRRAEHSCREASETSTCVDVNLNSAVLLQECNLEAQTSLSLQKSPSFENRPSLPTHSLEECTQEPMDAADLDVSLHQEQLRQIEGHINGNKFKPSDDLSSVKDCNENTLFSKEQLPPPNSSGGDQPRIAHGPDPRTESCKTSQKMNDRISRDEEAFDMNSNQKKGQPIRAAAQAPPSDSIVLRKQGSFEHKRIISPSLERKAQLARRPWGSPTRPTTPPSPKPIGSPQRRLPTSPAKTAGVRAVTQEHQDDLRRSSGSPKPPSKVGSASGIPKAIPQHPARPEERREPEKRSGSSPPPNYPPKPKNVRPKIITSIRRSPQAKPHLPDVPYEASTAPPRLTTHAGSSPSREPKAGAPGRVSASSGPCNLPHDKHRQEVDKSRCYSPDLLVSGVRPPGHSAPQRLTGKSESFCEELTEKYSRERSQGISSSEGPGYEDPSAGGRQRAVGGLCSPRALRPQLGLGVVTRLPSAKTRTLLAGQRSALPFGHPARAASPPAHWYQEATGEPRRAPPEPAPRSLLPQPGVSGLRLPGYTRLPTARVATFGFIRSASVTSVSSEGPQNDPNRPFHRLSSGSDDPSLPRTPAPGEAQPQAPGRSSPHPPGAPIPPRRSLLPPPRGSPLSCRKEAQKDLTGGGGRPLVSSPKRFAAVPPKTQSPVHTRQRPASGGRAGVSCTPTGSPRRGVPDSERQLLHLRGRCQEQAHQLQGLRAELASATLGLDAFAIATMHFHRMSEDALVKQRALSLELARIRDEAASSVLRWEQLREDKEELEQSCERELQALRVQQEAELGALETGLTARYTAQAGRLREEQRIELGRVHTQHQEQIEEMNGNHEAALSEMENAQLVAMAMLQEAHAKTLMELKEAHEQQRKQLEQDFEKLRLSLQDQVDTLTFQNRSLRDRAKRFEEALRKSTDEQILDALAPYQHVKEDLKSLKEVLEMKNQQIHKQEMKITELEKMTQKNVVLEERVQVLQQQNEDLKARIDRNIVTSRQLSEENANLQVYVERESNEKKRLSRTNEELLWRLQTGELSPRMLSPTSSPGPASPAHHAALGPASPAHHAALGPASPAHHAALGPASPAHHAALGPASPGHHAVLGPASPAHHAVLGSASPAHHAVLGPRREAFPVTGSPTWCHS
nr:microtubule-associated tumor suppressor candidate 2-like [Paramormyrops kingsleyae]